MNRPFIKKMGLWTLPRILIVQLKRFLYDATKITTYCDFPVSDWDLSAFVDGPKGEQILDSYLA